MSFRVLVKKIHVISVPILFIIGIGFSFCCCMVKQKDRFYVLYQKLHKDYVKHKSYYRTYTMWMNLLQTNHSIAEYFTCTDRVAVYGMGKIGENICRELSVHGINLVCGIDKNSIGENKTIGLTVYPPNVQLPDTDYIIISVAYLADVVAGAINVSSGVKILTIDELIEKISDCGEM